MGVDELIAAMRFTGHSGMWKFIQRHPSFPRPARFGRRSVWDRGAVRAWLDANPTARPNASVPDAPSVAVVVAPEP